MAYFYAYSMKRGRIGPHFTDRGKAIMHFASVPDKDAELCVVHMDTPPEDLDAHVAQEGWLL